MIRLFEGYEAEGRFRGVKTLFVSGQVPWDILAPCLKAKECGYGQVYFGADKCSAIDWKTVNYSTKILPIVTVELGQHNLPPSWNILGDAYVHTIINVQRFDEHGLMEILHAVWGERVQLKFDTEDRSYLAPLNSFLQNRKSDIQKDKELWRDETTLKS